MAGVDYIFEALIVLPHETLHRVGHCPGLLPRACLGRSEIRAPDAAAPDAELQRQGPEQKGRPRDGGLRRAPGLAEEGELLTRQRPQHDRRHLCTPRLSDST